MIYSREFLIMALANFFTMSSISTFFLFPLFITRHGGTKADIGIMMAVFTIASIVSRPWISEMIDRLGRKRCYTLACLVLSFLPLVYLLFKGNLSSFYIPLLLVRFIHGIGMALAVHGAVFAALAMMPGIEIPVPEDDGFIGIFIPAPPEPKPVPEPVERLVEPPVKPVQQ